MEGNPVPGKALSIKQPWAALILTGQKGVENRSWWSPWRGRFLVHTGQKPDDTYYAWDLAQGQGLEVADLPTGAYLGSVDLVDVHLDDDCCRPWGEPGQYHWVVTAPVTFPEPIPGPGQLNLYRTPDDIRALLEAQGA